jgi:hypothetical protein
MAFEDAAPVAENTEDGEADASPEAEVSGVEEAEDRVDPLSMSDEEYAKLPPPEDGPIMKDEDTHEDDDDESDDEAALKIAQDEAKKDAEEAAAEGDVTGDEDGAGGDKTSTDDSTDPAKDGEAAEAKPDDGKPAEDPPKDGEEAPKDDGDKGSKDEAPNYQAQVEEMLAPFKANNREVKVETIADARKLMQMGANYNKKMAGLKPHMKIVRMLENNGLLDEGKLNYLIDLDKQNPDAITKLIKDSGIDPLNVDTNAENGYKPNSYTVDDKEVDLSSVLDDIESTDTFKDTIEVVSTKWDEASKRVIIGEPEIVRTINEHMTSGVFAEISDNVANERMLGRLKGLSDLEAYHTVGESMQEKGQFKAQIEAKKLAAVDTTKPIPEKDDKPNDEEVARKKRKRAASGTRSSPASAKGRTDYDPLAISDEEFLKLAAPLL